MYLSSDLDCNYPWIWSFGLYPRLIESILPLPFLIMWCSEPWRIWLEHVESLGRWHMKGEQPVPWRVSLIPVCWSCILAPLYSTAGWDVCLWPTLPVIRLPVMEYFQNKAASSAETQCKPAHCMAFWNLGTLKDSSSKNMMYTDFFDGECDLSAFFHKGNISQSWRLYLELKLIL